MGRTYPNEINRLLFMPGGPVGKLCRSIALDIASESERNAIQLLGQNPGDQPRTGAFARSFRVQVIPGSNTFTVSNPKKYALALERGARAHDIKARRTEVLQFRGRDGVWRRVKVVKHPGLRNPFHILERSMTAVMLRRFGSVTRG